ncbi:uncharacterized protein [Procambarus clarkii]|uniref:uncharacterized protein isoform X2 n=1 Tax=Procambarus clarkii TaxID=6728 RepID=UPI003743C1B3
MSSGKRCMNTSGKGDDPKTQQAAGSRLGGGSAPDGTSPTGCRCLADYLDVSSVNLEGVKEFVGRYCGGKMPSPLLTLHPRLELLLNTNLALQAQGFSAQYIFIHEETVKPPALVVAGKEVCGGLVEGPGGSLISPGFPQHFPGGLSCTWLLRARPHHHVYLSLHQLQLQGSIANCQRAELAIHDGYQSVDRLEKRLKSFCGDLYYYRNQADKVFLSQWNRLIVTFRTGESSDNTTKFAGFHLYWTEVLLTTQENCSNQQGFWCPWSVYCVGVSMDGGCITTANFCIHPSLVCDGQPNCSQGDHSDETQCDDVVIIATASTVGICGVLVTIVSMAIVWVKWKRRTIPLTSSYTAQTLVTTPSVFSTTLSNSMQGPDLGADVAWMESSVPTPPPPPFLSSPLLSSHYSLHYPHTPILSSPPPLSHTQPIMSPRLSLRPTHSSVPMPFTNSSPVSSPLLPSPPKSSWPLLSPPATPTPPPPPLSETRESKWPKSFSTSSASPKHKITDSGEVTHTSGKNDILVSNSKTENGLEMPVSVSDAGSSESHVSSQPSTVHSTSTSSTILDVRQLNLPERQIIQTSGENVHKPLITYRPCSNHTHCSHCPYSARPNTRCHHQRRACGLVRSNSLPKYNTTSTDQIGQGTVCVGHSWPRTPTLTRRGSCIAECANDQGRESPEQVRCFSCLSTPSRTVKKTTPVTLQHRGRIGWPSSHWCPHMIHHCGSHGHFCHGNHAIICSTYSQMNKQ